MIKIKYIKKPLGYIKFINTTIDAASIYYLQTTNKHSTKHPMWTTNPEEDRILLSEVEAEDFISDHMKCGNLREWYTFVSTH